MVSSVVPLGRHILIFMSSKTTADLKLLFVYAGKFCLSGSAVDILNTTTFFSILNTLYRNICVFQGLKDRPSRIQDAGQPTVKCVPGWIGSRTLQLRRLRR